MYKYAGMLFLNEYAAQRMIIHEFFYDGVIPEDDKSEEIADLLIEADWDIPGGYEDKDELISLIDQLKEDQKLI
jgi:hypothetical protein